MRQSSLPALHSQGITTKVSLYLANQFGNIVCLKVGMTIVLTLPPIMTIALPLKLRAQKTLRPATIEDYIVYESKIAPESHNRLIVSPVSIRPRNGMEIEDPNIT